MKRIIKKSVTVELTPQEIALVTAYQDEHSCSRMAAVRALIRGSNEEQRVGKEVQLLGARVDALSARVSALLEAMQQLVTATKDIRLGVAFGKIAIEEINKNSPAMQVVRQRYNELKGK